MIRIDQLSVRRPGFSLKSVDLSVEQGEFFCLLGPAGAGKTLIVESVAGVVTIAGGRIVVSGRDVTGLPPERRGVGIVYQDCALFPHLSVARNIDFGLRYHHRSTPAGRARCSDLIDRLGLASLLDRSVTTISNQGFFAELTVDGAGVIFKTVMLTSSLLAMDLRQGKAVNLHIDPADIHLI